MSKSLISTKPPAVVDSSLQPITNPSSIGNGSTGNAQVRLKPYSYNGKEGISVQLLALQVTDLKGGGDPARPRSPRRAAPRPRPPGLSGVRALVESGV
mgnify:CR=1 FL=1